MLIGQVINTNAAWLGEQLAEIGINCNRVIVLPDKYEVLLSYITKAAAKNNLVFISGGLGPTDDDLTKEVLCKVFDSHLIEDAKALKDITNVFKSFGKEVTPRNLEQALVPHNCKVLYNSSGTAPGMLFETDQCMMFSLPGVPFELKHIYQNQIFPLLKHKYPDINYLNSTILTIGTGESYLADVLESYESELPEFMSLAYLPSPGQVRIRLNLKKGGIEAKNVFQSKLIELNQLLLPYSYGKGKETIEDVTFNLLNKYSKSLAVAESCTGGHLSSRIVNIPGASKIFKGSIIAYHNELKINELGVDENVIRKHGAVSSQCVEAMALNIKTKFKSDYGLSTSGIAGPSGGSTEKPIGLVYIGISGPSGTSSHKFQLGHARKRFIEVSSSFAINILRKTILSDWATVD